MSTVIGYLNDFISLFYPVICVACGENLFHNELSVCTKCLNDIPKTNYHRIKNNPVEELFWGRTRIENATSYYFYGKGSRFQTIIHEFKYKGMKHVAYELGKLFGSEIRDSRLSGIDVIVPVPLHPKKLKARGYNQSEFIARGISETVDKQLLTGNLIRIRETETQTRKSRFDRWKNVEGIFACTDPDAIYSKHVLLVDDVVTTGSTLEACANTILDLDGTKVSVATLAVAKY